MVNAFSLFKIEWKSGERYLIRMALPLLACTVCGVWCASVCVPKWHNSDSKRDKQKQVAFEMVNERQLEGTV